MSRTAGRHADQTRELILKAAADTVRERGISATLDEIADAAGVSKGGVIYHFGSKDTLLLCLAQALLDDFRTAVHAAVDPIDRAPGRLARAYLQVSFQPDIDARTVRDSLVLIAQLITAAEIASVAAADNRRWADDFAADGLPRHVQDLVVSAADGIGMAALWGATPDQVALDGLHRQLVVHTRDSALWAALGQPLATEHGG